MKLLYFICMTNRSGSSWFCSMLRSTGAVGDPRELKCHPGGEEPWKSDLDVCGIKLSSRQLLRIEPASLDSMCDTRYLWLKRADTLRQAISTYRARETGVWHRPAGSTVDSLDGIEFNAKEILRLQQRIKDQDRLFCYWFEHRQITPHVLWYEDLLQDHRKEVTSAIESLGCSYDGTVDPGSYLIMRDDLTEEWVARIQDYQSSEAIYSGKPDD